MIERQLDRQFVFLSCIEGVSERDLDLVSNSEDHLSDHEKYHNYDLHNIPVSRTNIIIPER